MTIKTHKTDRKKNDRVVQKDKEGTRSPLWFVRVLLRLLSCYFATLRRLGCRLPFPNFSENNKNHHMYIHNIYAQEQILVIVNYTLLHNVNLSEKVKYLIISGNSLDSLYSYNGNLLIFVYFLTKFHCKFQNFVGFIIVKTFKHLHQWN